MSEAYEVRCTPSALVVCPDGTVGSPVAGGAEAIRDLVARAVEAPSPNAPLLAGAPASNGGCLKCGKRHPAEGEAQAMPAGLKIGEAAPEVKLKDLSGKEIDLADLQGEETLVLFWNPGCGFCQQMLPDLKEWEENRPKEAPRLLVVSAGTEEANEAMGLSSLVVLDQNFAAGRSFGAAGTPSAVLVDSEGKIASEVAVGAPAVLELAGAGQKEGK